ncbi:PerC family transcriptional regulator [Salmonella bongori]|uniref:PerC family transcriptional regulator n=2 Tax=Salmonella TaxID=590 RepID=A0A750P0Q0_SALER|nr:PerC family transcriptional regulator [Salmonella bongori]EGS1129232.1 PerC family transcriptional regulator [Salmonella bongori CFSAN000509]MBA2135905.1 PerC family transcriptional regulator [Salmonella bongori serovar 66:z39:-]HAC6694981.1 PerC family transcriptional regulator [Salmonella bongori serovar 44:r:-]
MPQINYSITHDAALRDEIAEALERAGLWRRAATRWLHVFDSLNSDKGREHIAQRREACLLIASSYADRNSGSKRRKIYLTLLELEMSRT